MTEIPTLLRDEIFFLFIDLQEKLLAKIPESEKLISRNIFLVECARVLEIPYLATTQYKKGLGEIPPGLASKLDTPSPDKSSFSCCGDSTIREKLLGAGRNWIVVSGIETHICVLQTVLDLLRAGHRVAVVRDAVGARQQCDHDAGLRRMEQSGALIVTAEMLLYEVLGRSDSQEFRKLLPIIKSL